MPFKQWKDKVDERYRDIYGISLADVGDDDDRLSRAWRNGEEPEEYVRWVGEKYDLIPLNLAFGL